MVRGRCVAWASDVVLEVIGDDGLLLKLDREVVFSLNSTGTRIAQLIDARRDVAGIVAVLAAEYGVAADDIAPEVEALIGELADRQLVTWLDGARQVHG